MRTRSSSEKTGVSPSFAMQVRSYASVTVQTQPPSMPEEPIRLADQ